MATCPVAVVYPSWRRAADRNRQPLSAGSPARPGRAAGRRLVSRSARIALRLVDPFSFDPADLQRQQCHSRVVAVDVKSGAVFGGFASVGQVRPQTLEPLVADGVGRVVVARSGSPLAIGVPGIRQAGSPALDRVVPPRCRLEIIWCLCSELAASRGNQVSPINLTTPMTPAVDAPATKPIRPIPAMLIRRSLHPRAVIATACGPRRATASSARRSGRSPRSAHASRAAVRDSARR